MVNCPEKIPIRHGTERSKGTRRQRAMMKENSGTGEKSVSGRWILRETGNRGEIIRGEIDSPWDKSLKEEPPGTGNRSTRK